MAATLIAGLPGTLAATFTSMGLLADPELPVTLTITPLAGGDPVLTTTGVDHPDTGTFTYAWTPDDVDTATDYTVRWDAAGGDDAPAIEVVTVLPATAGTWATTAEVLAITGQTRDAATVALASSIIETYAGASVEMPTAAISPRDRRHLARATAWQAAWLTPARIASLVTERESSRSVSADSVRIERKTDADNMLAPLAARELKSLSWVGTRTIRPLPESSKLVAWSRINFLNERSDGLV